MLAIGGDGTANEAAWGLLGTRTALGLVPMGSGNGLARTLGIPLRRTARWPRSRTPCRARWTSGWSTAGRS